jgi:alcohol dehydrogenase
MQQPEPVRRFEMPRVKRVLEGRGAVEALAAEIDRRDEQHVVLLSGPTAAQLPEFGQLRESLGHRFALARTDVRPHNPSESVAQLVEGAREAGADLIVAVGGGSATDAAKLVSYALAEEVSGPGELVESLDREEPSGARPVPVAAVPTTLSAAEWNGLAGLTVERERTKRRLNRPGLAPTMVALDPDIARHTPRPLWTSTGARAVDHAVEALYAADAHPFGEGLAVRALGMLAENLPRSARDAEDVEATLACQRAAEMAALALLTATSGLSHAIGHQLGAAGVPHGATSCVMLPHVMRLFADSVPDRMGVIAGALGGSGSAVAQIEQLFDELGVPRRLGEFGLADEHLDAVAAATMTAGSALAAAPLPVRQEDVHRLLREAL